MPKYSLHSLDHLYTCAKPLQRLFIEVIKYRDNTILEGWRGKELQHEYFLEGKSKKDWPDGGHNAIPSNAVDSVPFPIDWGKVNKGDRAVINKMYHYAGIVLGIAWMMEIPIRWGGDWDGDGEITDQQFHDLPHFELIKGE
jgi:peptidoglycan LD-endopeptidase CwlK